MVLRHTFMDSTFVRAIIDGSADEGYASIHLAASGRCVYEEKVEVPMPPHKVYLHTYHITTFTGTHEAENDDHTVNLKLDACVSQGVVVRQPARGGKLGPRPGGRPAFLAAPMPQMGWKRPLKGTEVPAPSFARPRRDPSARSTSSS